MISEIITLKTSRFKSTIFFSATLSPKEFYIDLLGGDYSNKDSFDVFTIYDGTVIDVNEEELLGKTAKRKEIILALLELADLIQIIQLNN